MIDFWWRNIYIYTYIHILLYTCIYIYMVIFGQFIAILSYFIKFLKDLRYGPILLRNGLVLEGFLNPKPWLQGVAVDSCSICSSALLHPSRHCRHLLEVRTMLFVLLKLSLAPTRQHGTCKRWNTRTWMDLSKYGFAFCKLARIPSRFLCWRFDFKSYHVTTAVAPSMARLLYTSLPSESAFQLPPASKQHPRPTGGSIAPHLPPGQFTDWKFWVF